MLSKRDWHISEEEYEMKKIHDVSKKKENVEMWDQADEASLEFSQKIQEIFFNGSAKNLLEEDEKLFLAKEILDTVIPVIETHTKKEVLFVDCDF